MALLIAALVMLSATLRRENQTLRATVIGSQSYRLEVASTDEQRTVGLSNRKTLAEDSGMLFLFLDNDKHCFWMKDTYIALDMIWLNAQNAVTNIYENVTPETYPKGFCSNNDGRFGIELPAGSVRESGVQVGHYIDVSGALK